MVEFPYPRLPKKKQSVESIKGGISSSMQGMVLSLKVKVEDIVAEGDTVAVIEAMKMENLFMLPIQVQ